MWAIRKWRVLGNRCEEYENGGYPVIDVGNKKKWRVPGNRCGEYWLRLPGLKSIWLKLT